MFWSPNFKGRWISTVGWCTKKVGVTNVVFYNNFVKFTHFVYVLIENRQFGYQNIYKKNNWIWYQSQTLPIRSLYHQELRHGKKYPCHPPSLWYNSSVCPFTHPDCDLCFASVTAGMSLWHALTQARGLGNQLEELVSGVFVPWKLKAIYGVPYMLHIKWQR